MVLESVSRFDLLLVEIQKATFDSIFLGINFNFN